MKHEANYSTSLYEGTAVTVAVGRCPRCGRFEGRGSDVVEAWHDAVRRHDARATVRAAAMSAEALRVGLALV